MTTCDVYSKVLVDMYYKEALSKEMSNYLGNMMINDYMNDHVIKELDYKVEEDMKP